MCIKKVHQSAETYGESSEKNEVLGKTTATTETYTVE